MKKLKIGIDAVNLRQGGGRTHIIEILKSFVPPNFDFEVVIWGSKETLSLIVDKPWITKSNYSFLEKGLIFRLFWQIFFLPKVYKNSGCDLLFVPGGVFFLKNVKVVTMSQNLLPFEMKEVKRYGFRFQAFKLLILRFVQLNSFEKSTGLIFLSNYASNVIKRNLDQLNTEVAVVHHGLNNRFRMEPRFQYDISQFTELNPFRILYVSNIDFYKHQWDVVKVVAGLRKETGWPLRLDFVGPFYPPALLKLKKELAEYDIEGSWVKYHGSIDYIDLHKFYFRANLGLFASTCENMPIILLEMMGAGLPIVSSNFGPMPEILEDSGVYFNPEDLDDMKNAIQTMVISKELRGRLAQSSYKLSEFYTWSRCAQETFDFLMKVSK
jgi:glycosyltransferase involved in cell wall biosynthesis